jgi:hypothetical protein
MTSFRRLAFASRPRVFFFSPSSLFERPIDRLRLPHRTRR